MKTTFKVRTEMMEKVFSHTLITSLWYLATQPTLFRQHEPNHNWQHKVYNLVKQIVREKFNDAR